MGSAKRSSRAEVDIDELAGFIAQRNPDVARDFLTAVERTIELLATTPGIGSGFAIPGHPQLRCHPVLPRFRNYLVFYEPTADGISIVRVLHGHRDLPKVLDDP